MQDLKFDNIKYTAFITTATAFVPVELTVVSGLSGTILLKYV